MMTDKVQNIETMPQLTPLSQDNGSLTFYKDRIINGDSLAELAKIPSSIFNMCVTSPPYWENTCNMG
jgi:hypothetical protein